MRQSRMVRFTALALRNGETSNISHGLTSFGLSRNGCKQYGDILPNADMASLTLSFTEEQHYDGWFLVTGMGPLELDPDLYVVESLEDSKDGKFWRHLAGSWLQCGCFEKGTRLPSAQHVIANQNKTAITSLPEERGGDVHFSFRTWSCLWPYYLIIVSQFLHGISLLIAPLLNYWLERQDVAFTCISSGITNSTVGLFWHTTGFVLAHNRSPLTFTRSHNFHATFPATIVSSIVTILACLATVFSSRGGPLFRDIYVVGSGTGFQKSAYYSIRYMD
jgi:hypothetical protein